MNIPFTTENVFWETKSRCHIKTFVMYNKHFVTTNFFACWSSGAPCQPGALRTSVSCLPVNAAVACVCRSAPRDGRQAWLPTAAAPPPLQVPAAAGPRPTSTTVPGSTWPCRGAPPYCPSPPAPARRGSAPVSEPSAFAGAASSLVVSSSSSSAAAAGHGKASSSTAVSTKCPTGATQHSSAPTDFNSHVKCAIRAFNYVESYTVFICQQSYLLLFGDHPLTLFHSRLKTFLFLQILPTAALHFFFLNIHYMDSPDCLLLFLSISVFYFFCFYTF